MLQVRWLSPQQSRTEDGAWTGGLRGLKLVVGPPLPGDEVAHLGRTHVDPQVSSPFTRQVRTQSAPLVRWRGTIEDLLKLINMIMVPIVPDERAGLCCWFTEDPLGALGEDRLVLIRAGDDVVQVSWRKATFDL